jgi:copper chaperone CopZ
MRVSVADFLGVLAVALLMAGLTSCADRPLREEGPTEQAVIAVDGMVCSACVARVEKAVGAAEGVTRVVAMPHLNEVRVTFEPDKVSTGELAAILDGLGYTSGPIE